MVGSQQALVLPGIEVYEPFDLLADNIRRYLGRTDLAVKKGFFRKRVETLDDHVNQTKQEIKETIDAAIDAAIKEFSGEEYQWLQIEARYNAARELAHEELDSLIQRKMSIDRECIQGSLDNNRKIKISMPVFGVIWGGGTYLISDYLMPMLIKEDPLRALLTIGVSVVVGVISGVYCILPFIKHRSRLKAWKREGTKLITELYKENLYKAFNRMGGD